MAIRAVRLLATAFLLLVLALALFAGLHTVSDFDMGWHLATGRWVVEHRQIPSTDVLSFTSAGQPWIYPPFAGVLFYLIYQVFGYAGLSWLMALLCLATVAYLVRRRQVAATLLAMLAVQSIAARITPRADLFSTVFFALFLGELWSYQRRQSARLWLLPCVMFLWVNLHPGFIAGLGVLGAYLLLEIAELPFSGRRELAVARLRRAAPWMAAALVATLLNPWGWKVYGVARMLFGLGPAAGGKINSSSFIAEYQAVPISWHLLRELVDLRHVENGFVSLLFVAIVLIGIALWKKQPGAALLLGVALYEGLSHARYMALFVILTATVGPALLDGLVSCRRGTNGEENTKLGKSGAGTPHHRPALRIPAAAGAVLLAALCGVALVRMADYASNRTYIVFGADFRFGAGESAWFPERAAAFIEREHLPGNLFEEYALGGYEALRLGPKYPDFLDGRSDRLRPDLVAEQRALYSADPDSERWQHAADRWKLNVVLVAVSGFHSLEKLSPLAFCQSKGWSAVYMDDSGMVFLRNLPENRPWIDRFAIDCGTQQLSPPPRASRVQLRDFYFSAGALYSSLHRDSESERALRRAAALYPADPNAHLLLAELMQRQRRWDEAEREFRKSLKLNESSAALLGLGRVYVSQNRLGEAVTAIQRAAEMSVQPTDMYLMLAELELGRNLPKQALEMYAKAERHSPYRNGGESLVPGLYAQIAEGRSEAYRLQGNWAEAVRLQRRSVELTPDNARRWERLAYMYEATGQGQLAAAAMERAAALRAAASASTPASTAQPGGAQP
jgi:tetratricopeptide (TPR) repeat protein